MKLPKIQIVPEITAILLPSKHIDISGTNISYEQGYGQLSEAGATVQLGVTGNIYIDIMIESLSKDFYRETTDEVINVVSESVRDELKEHCIKEDYKSWWFALFAGGSTDKHSSDYYRNQQKDSVNIADTTCYHAISSKMSSYKQQYHVSGDFQIVGQSYIPTTVYLFIETLTVKTQEGTTILIPTQNTAVADKDGNTGSASTSSKINIVPL